MPRTFLNKKVIFLCILALSWLLVNIYLFNQLGIKYMIDTYRYIEEAEYWRLGKSSEAYHWWYSGYILLLFLSKSIFSSYSVLVIAQGALSLSSILFSYLALEKYVSPFAAFASSLFLVVYLPIQQWNVYLLTESLFLSFIILFFSSYSGIYKRWTLPLQIIFAGMVLFVRPNGFTLILAILSAWALAKFFLNHQNRWLSISFLAVGLTVALLVINQYGFVFAFFIQKSFANGEIICGYLGHSIKTNYQVNYTEKDSVIILIKMLLNHPITTLQLFFWKLFYLFLDIRPFYTSIHNIFILVTVIPFYTIASFGAIVLFNKQLWLFLVLVFFILFNTIIVLASYVDWDGRFLAPILVSMVFMFAFGVQKLSSAILKS